MKVTVGPCSHSGQPVRIPGSKSISHRTLIAAALSKEPAVISGLVENNDTEATIRCLKQLGASFVHNDDGTLTVTGIGDCFHYDGNPVDCGESGSTLRFLIPIFSLCGQKVIFTGHGKLMQRPQTVYEELFRSQSLLFKQDADILTIQGPLHAGHFHIPGNISSQFISGLLFALPLLNEDSVLEILEPYESGSYVGLTEDILEQAGIRFIDEGNRITIFGRQTYHCPSLTVDGDDSQAAFFAGLALTGRLPVTVQGMRHESRQGDHVIVELIERAGGHSIPMENGFCFEPDQYHGFNADLADCPDLGPILFALAAGAEGTSTFYHCGRLRIKESDRIEAMKEELSKLGIRLIEQGETVSIEGNPVIEGGVELDGHNDHRIVMALAVLAVKAKRPVIINGAEAVRKSYPAFFDDLKTAGAEVTYGD